MPVVYAQGSDNPGERVRRHSVSGITACGHRAARRQACGRDAIGRALSAI